MEIEFPVVGNSRAVKKFGFSITPFIRGRPKGRYEEIVKAEASDLRFVILPICRERSSVLVPAANSLPIPDCEAWSSDGGPSGNSEAADNSEAARILGPVEVNIGEQVVESVSEIKFIIKGFVHREAEADLSGLAKCCEKIGEANICACKVISKTNSQCNANCS